MIHTIGSASVPQPKKKGKGNSQSVKMNPCNVFGKRKGMKKILVVAPAWVGDMVMAQSLFKQLKRLSPHCLIDVLAVPWVLPLTARMDEVRHSIELPLNHGRVCWQQRYQLGKALRAEHYQQAIILPNSFKSALIPFFARIPVRTGFVGEWRYPLLNDWRPLKHRFLLRTVDRFVALALAKNAPLPEHIPQPRLAVNPAQSQTAIDALGLAVNAKTLVLCAGAEYGTAKQWPAEHFAVVANEKIAQGWQVWLLGSANDAAVSEAICKQIEQKQHVVNLAGKTTLLQACDLIAVATAVVSNDSGLMHIAAALDKPLFALFGSSDPRFTPPLSRHAHVLSLDLACSPCFKRQCPLKHHDCLRQLLPSHVLSRMAQI